MPHATHDHGDVTADSNHDECFGSAFATFADTMRASLAPETPLERVLAERVVLAAWRLHEMSRVETEAVRDRETAGFGPAVPPIDRDAARAATAIESAMTLLTLARDEHRRGSWGRAYRPPFVPATEMGSETGTEIDFPDLSNEWPTVPDVREDDEPADAGDSWEDRLVVDPSVSQTSPVVRGTWVTARQVVTLIVDGWSWADVLRAHPELTEADVRACLSYTVEQDEFEAA